MGEALKWLPETNGTVWAPLGHAMQSGLPVPAGFVVLTTDAEIPVRAAYEQLKLRERVHFVALRSVLHPVLNVIGPDPLIHTLRRLWAESPGSPVLVQRMIPAVWCGKAQRDQRSLRIKANEGMMLLDPDTYVVNSETHECIAQLEPKQRKMIRHVDGSAKVVRREGARSPMTTEQLKSIADLAERAGRDIGWAIDDNDRVWLISI